MSGKTSGSPRHPSSRHPRPSEEGGLLKGCLNSTEGGNSETRDSEVRDSENRDSENRDSEGGKTRSVTGTLPETEISNARDSEVRGSESRDSEAGDSESRDSEVGIQEMSRFRAPLIQTPLRLPLISGPARDTPPFLFAIRNCEFSNQVSKPFKPGCLQFLRGCALLRFLTLFCALLHSFAPFCVLLRTCVCAHLCVSASDRVWNEGV